MKKKHSENNNSHSPDFDWQKKFMTSNHKVNLKLVCSVIVAVAGLGVGTAVDEISFRIISS